MRAFAVDSFGEAGSIHDLPVPEPAEGQVRVRVEAASINPFDLFVLKGFLKDRMEHHFPLIPCSDFSGVVDAIGPGVTGLSRGDRIFGTTGMRSLGKGTLAEYATASLTTIAATPPGLSAVEAAALPLAGVSALQSVDAVDPHERDVVVVVGASGAIGGYAVQLAAMRGARVTGVTSAAHVGYVMSLGAAEVVDRTLGDVAAALKAKHPGGVAAVIDTTSDAPALASYAELVRKGGTVTSMRGAAAVEELEKRGVRGVNISTAMTAEKLAELAGLVAGGKLKPGLIHEFPLEQAAEALALSGQAAGGKIVVTI